MSKLLDSAVVIALFTGFLFALSTANYNGYLSELGVESGFILRSSHQILYNALFVILTPLLHFLLWSFFAVGVLRVFATIYTTIARDFYKVRKLMVKFRKKLRFSYHESKSEILVNQIMDRFRIGKAFLSALILLGFLAYAEHEGHEKARETLNDLKNGKYEPHEVVKISGNDSDIYIVSCGTNNCAGITISKMEIVYFENKYSLGMIKNVTKTSKGSS